LGILSMLVMVGYFGHVTSWSFTPVGQEKGLNEKHSVTTTAVTKPRSDGVAVEFCSEESVRKSGISTMPTERRTVREFVKGTGVITYDQRLTAELSSRVSGTIWNVSKQAGDSVKKGDLLLVIDSVDVGKAKTEFLSAMMTTESKSESLGLFEKNAGVIPDQQLREARIALRESKLRLINAEQTLINLGLAVKASDFTSLSDTDRATKLHFLGLPEEVANKFDPASTTSNLLPLVAPFDGVMIGHEAVLGENVEAGKPVMEIANIERMWVRLNVPKEDGLNLVLGQPVRFLVDGIEEELNSRITWISTAVDEQTRTLQVRAEVDNPLTCLDTKSGRVIRALRANTYGTGLILIRESVDAVCVPITALTATENGPMIFVQTGDRSFRRLDVSLGIRDGRFVELLSGGLNPGQKVVTHGNHVLKSEWLLNRVASTGQ
jgi:cobalt-zinc-cadmium efflux system membrane fusion protein